MFEPSRYKASYGGRGSAKSHSFAQALVLKGAEKPMRFLCCREIQKSIKDSVKQLLDDKIRDSGLGWFYTSTQGEIRGKNGTVFLFAGLRNNPEAVKSMENIDVCWVEEASTVSRRSLDLLIPTIRAEESEIWFTWNPDSEYDPVDVMFRGEKGPPPDSIIIPVSYEENPYFPKVLMKELEYDKEADNGKYLHVWKGDYADAQDGKMYPSEILEWQKQFLEDGTKVGDWTVFANFNRKHTYVMAADVAEGVGLDSSTAHILDLTDGEVVAEFVSNIIEPDLFGHELYNWANKYGGCLIAPERNSCGLATVIKLKELGAIVYFEEEKESGTNKVTKKLGWRTTSKSKPLMLYDLKDALTEKLIKVKSRGLYKELKTYNPEDLRQIRFDPEQTRHWDRVMSCFVKGTSVLTDKGQRPIESIKVGDKVLTREGYKKVIATCGHVKEVTTNIGLTGTLDHPVFCNDNEIKDLSYVSTCDKLYAWDSKAQKIERLSHTEMSNTTDTLMQLDKTTEFTTEEGRNGKKKAFTCIGKSGLMISGTFQKDMLSIIKTMTRAITSSKTLCVCQKQSTTSSTAILPGQKKGEESWPIKTGKSSPKGYEGITKTKKGKILSAFFVDKSLKVLLGMQSFVLGGVSRKAITQNDGIQRKKKHALSVRKNSKQASLIKKDVQKSVMPLEEGSTYQTVYNLQVQGCPEYFANNVLVHNCAITWQMRDKFVRRDDKELEKAIDNYIYS